MSETIARIYKSRTGEIRIVRDKYEGRNVVDIRVWFFESASGLWKPSAKGVQFDESKLDSVIAGLHAASR